MSGQMKTWKSFSVCLLLILGVQLFFLADSAILLSRLRAGGSGYGLNGGSQGAEEAGDEG